MSEVEVTTYTPFPKQQAFHRSPAKYRLFGGAAGPGKSRSLLEEGILQANEVPGINTLLMRRTFPELESTLIDQFRKHIPREQYKSFNEAKHLVTWWNDSTTRFGYCQHERDVYQYQGGEYLFIGIDELTHFTLKQWQYLTTRNRCPIPGTFPNMAGATNPGNIGHAWVKALFVDKVPMDGMEDADQYDPNDYEFIPALLSDNPIYATDKAYRKALQALPTALRDALLNGKWDVFAGQYFDIWDAAEMVDRPEEWELKPWHPRWISIDWGFEHPAAAYWHAQREKDHTVTYREWVVNRTGPRDLARGIAKRTDEKEKIDTIYLSPDAFAKRTDEASIAEQMGDVLVEKGLPRPIPADNDRIGGWMQMYQMLASGHWRIGNNCPKLIAVLPTLVRDDKHVEDIAKVLGDDPADGARYGLKSRHAIRMKPLEMRVQEGIEQRIGKPLKEVKPEEYTNVMIQRGIVIEQEKKSGQPVRLGRRRGR